MFIAPGSKSIVAPPSSSGCNFNGLLFFDFFLYIDLFARNFDLGTSVRKSFIYICHLNSCRYLPRLIKKAKPCEVGPDSGGGPDDFPAIFIMPPPAAPNLPMSSIAVCSAALNAGATLVLLNC